MLTRLGFSSAAATRSLSFSCLFTAPSEACDPGDKKISTLNLHGEVLIEIRGVRGALGACWRTRMSIVPRG